MMWEITLYTVNNEVDNGKALLQHWDRTWMAKLIFGVRHNKSIWWNLINLIMEALLYTTVQQLIFLNI